MKNYLFVCAFFFLFWTLVFVSLYEPLYKWRLLAFCCHNCHNKEESFGWIRASEPRRKFRLQISMFRLGHCRLRVPGEANSQFRRQGKYSQTTHLRLVFFVLFLFFSLSISKIFTLTGWWLKETQMSHPVSNVGLVSFIFKKWNVHEVVSEGGLKSWKTVALKTPSGCPPSWVAGHQVILAQSPGPPARREQTCIPGLSQ